MLQSALTWFVIVAAIICALSALSVVAGSLVYNVHESKRKNRQLKHPNARVYRSRPLITVFITTKNNQQDVEECLISLLKCSYRKLELIVIDSGSSDGTKSRIRDIISRYPARSIRLIARRSTVLRYSDLRAAYRKYGHGQIITVLGPDITLDKQALTNAINCFNAEPKVNLILPNQQTVQAYTTGGLLQRYSDLLDSRLKQLKSVTRTLTSSSGRIVIGRTTTLISLFSDNRLGSPDPDTFMKMLRLRPDVSCRYAVDVLVKYNQSSLIPVDIRRQYRSLHVDPMLFRRLESNGKLTLLYSWIITWTLNIAAVLSPLVITYFGYLAIKLHEPTLLITSVIAFSTFLITAVWDDAYSGRIEKIGYILFLPITYSWFYIMSLKLPLAILWSVIEN